MHQIQSLKENFVIVGHGLAGSVLAHILLEQGQEVMVIDACMPHSATKVSAGLINPLIGPKLNTPKDFPLCMKENLRFWGIHQKKSGKKFLESINFYRIFQSDDQKNKWKRLPDDYRVQTLSQLECAELGINAKLGAGITSAWKCNSSTFINYSRDHLISANRYRECHFVPEQWRNYQVIFCDGYRAARNQWFRHLPFTPAQGEVLKVNSPFELDASNGTWHLAEKHSGCARIGSSWKHHDLESGPTIIAKNQILEDLDYIPQLKTKRVINHKSGVRSSTKDRHPIMGAHPEIKKFTIFNGFGSRGCTTIPLCAKEFSDFLIRGKELPAHKDLRRFS